MNLLFNNIYKAVKKVTEKSSAKLHEPIFIGKEKNYLKDCIETTFVSTSGKYIKKFEEKIKNFTGAKHAVAVVNGTVALQMALRGLGVKENDEILIPSLTFVGTANAIRHCGAIPHFIDSDINSLGISLDNLEKHLKKISVKRGSNIINKITGRRIFAVVPVHVYGHMINMKRLKKISQKFSLKILEDAAESLGSYCMGKHSGTFGHAGIISFNANKIITTGGGGIILTSSSLLAKKIRHLITNAKIPHAWKFMHDKVGWNYRMPNINAALGCAQIEKINTILKYKKKITKKYQKEFKRCSKIIFVKEPSWCESNYWLNTIKINGLTISKRDWLLKKLNQNHLECRPAWTLLHKLSMYKFYPRSKLDNSEKLETSLITLPSSPKYGKK
tara:strand:- start:3461 stop:4624 length:1164 start_codon:yes stop_codon:yes gene_type:complete